MQKLNARVHRLHRKLDQQEQVKNVPYSRTKQQLVRDLSQFCPDLSWTWLSAKCVWPRSKQTTPKDKTWALSPLRSSPRTYRLSQRIFQLPSVKTLSHTMQNIPVYPGFDLNILEAMKQKESSMECKLCAVATDENICQNLSYNVKKDHYWRFWGLWITRENSACSKPCNSFHGQGSVVQMETAFGVSSLQWIHAPTPFPWRKNRFSTQLCLSPSVSREDTPALCNDIIPEFQHVVITIFQPETQQSFIFQSFVLFPPFALTFLLFPTIWPEISAVVNALICKSRTFRASFPVV